VIRRVPARAALAAVAATVVLVPPALGASAAHRHGGDAGAGRPGAGSTPGAVSVPGLGVTAPPPGRRTAGSTPAAGSFTMLMTGDVLLHDGFWQVARSAAGGNGLDFRPVLAPMRPTISSADLAVCHLETPLASPAGPFSGFPLFSVPPQIAPALAWAGYDACTTASNHSVDRGLAGIRRTLADLDRAGLQHTGTYADAGAAGRPLLLDAGPARVALIAATFGLNGLPLPADAPWAVDLIDPARIVREARAARAAGADVVVVALHWGEEYRHQPTAYQRAVAHRILRSGQVDLLYGHHAHVVQPYGRVDGHWVLYGLGNALAQQDPAHGDRWEGNAARVTFAADGRGGWTVRRVESIPTLVTPYGGAEPLRYLDVRRALRDPHWAYLRARLRLARDRVQAEVGALGALAGAQPSRAGSTS
jgi:poly-gamma-glutamate synthesis protein (capsule biosynthesis protein)